jgi:hypothetical protein
LVGPLFSRRPGHAEQDLHLREIIEKTMLYLEDRFRRRVPFVAAVQFDRSGVSALPLAYFDVVRPQGYAPQDW